MDFYYRRNHFPTATKILRLGMGGRFVNINSMIHTLDRARLTTPCSNENLFQTVGERFAQLKPVLYSCPSWPYDLRV